MRIFTVALALGAVFCSDRASAFDKRDSVGMTELMWTVQRGSIPRVKRLIEDGAEINAVSRGGVSVLAMTLYYQRPDVAKYLIQSGAQPANEKERVSIDAMLGRAGMGTIAQIARGDAPPLAPVPVAVAPAAPAPPVAAAPAPAAPQPSSVEPGFSSAENAEDYAVVIGVEKYDDLPAATYAERDAKAARAFIRALGVPERNIMSLTGTRATRTGFEKAFEAWLPNNVSEKSRVFVFYSGHGAPDPKTQDAYLVPADGDPQYLKQTGYPLKRLYSKLGELKAKSVLVALDSCFSGAGGRSVLAKGTRPLVGKVDLTSRTNPKISVITASSGSQISGSDDSAQHGLFTYKLLQGLNGAAKNGRGQVTLQSLYDYVKPKVQDEARRANREQTPQLQGSSPDSFILRAQ